MTAKSATANQIIIRGKCNDKNATFFVDTGSSVTLAAKTFVDFLGLTDQVKKTNVNLSSFTADKIKTYGEIILQVEVANSFVKHRMIITDLVDTHFLLGLDFLSDHQMNLDITRRCITSQAGESKFLQTPKQLLKRSAVKCARTYTVPASSVMFIKAKASDCVTSDNSTYSGFIEPKMNILADKGLLIDSGMCLTDNRLLPVRVTNLTNSPIQLYKNKTLGDLYPVDSNCDSHIRGVTPSKITTETVNKIAEDVIPDTKVKPKEWTQNRLWKELRIDDIKDVSEDEKRQLKDLVWRYKQCFSSGPFDLGKCNMYQADIKLKPDYKPSWIPARPVPYKLRAKMDEQIKGLEEAGVIEKCTEKSLFNSPVFLVKKPHQPEKMRFVVDMRAVNAECLPDNFQMPLIGHVVDKIAGSKWYSTFDLSQSFHQVEYNRESRHITAFTTSNGSRYWFRRLIMGHKTSGAQFSRCMTKILENLSFDELIFFLDDLLLASNDIASHLSRLEIVLQRLAAANMKLSPSKSHFLQKEVQFVGITINSEGLRITDERIKALSDLNAPTDRKSLQSLLGFFGFNRKWIPQFATLTHCMYRLLRKNVPFEWSQECDENLKKMKDAVRCSITLAVPDLYDRDQSYELVIDGSKVGMGAHLSQMINGERRIIGYFSKAVPSHKREWGQTKLELLTLFHAVKFWDTYLKGTSFVVKTDCLSLCHLDTIFSKSNPALRRKIQSLAEFSFNIQHISGASNSIADFFSRYPFKKKFKDSATQCDLYQASKTMAIAETKEDNVREAQRDFISKVTDLCDAKNKEKLTPQIKNEKSSTSPEIEPESQLSNGNADSGKTSTPPKTPEQVERLIPAGFFAKRRYKDSYVRVISLEDTTKEPPTSCLCDVPSNDNSVNAVEVEHSVTKSSESTENAAETMKIPKIRPTISSREVIQRSQDSDPILCTVKKWILAGEKPLSIQAFRAPKEIVSYWKQFNLLSMENGIIVRKWIPVKNGSPEKERHLICVPGSNQEAVLQMCHSSLMANHPGMKLTLNLVRQYYYWPGMSHDVELFVKACITCGRVKQPQSYSKAKRQHIMAHKFNDILVIDHVEPEKLGITGAGNKYILTMTDVFSGYVAAAATNSQKAVENISLIMHKWVLIHGVPREIVCDNAPGFRSAFYQAVLTSLNCKYTYGLPYECKSTSKAERTNKRLNQGLRLILEGKNPKTWDKYIDYVCSALNSMKNRHTGFSANYLLYGHELNTPISLLLENGDYTDVFDHADPNPYNKTAYAKHKAYKEILLKVSRNIQSSYAHEDMNFNKNIRNSPFKTGDLCFVMIRCPTHKFSPRWYGPVPILKVINDHVYVIKLMDKEKVVNISKLKRYHVNKYTPNSQDLTPKQHGTKGDNSTSLTEKTEKQSTEPGVQITVRSGGHEGLTSEDNARLATQDNQPSDITPNTQTGDSGGPNDDPVTLDISDNDSEPSDEEPETTQASRKPQRNRKQTKPLQIQPHRKTYV